MRIRGGPFLGANRRLAPHLLEPEQARDAVNARLDNGNLRPLRGLADSGDVLAKGAPILSLYRFTDTVWFHWSEVVHAVMAPVGDNTERVTAFTGDGEPKVTYASIATAGGSAEYPTNSFTLGVPAPQNAPTLSVGGEPDDEEDTAESRTYVYTFVATVAGRQIEGPPSPPADEVDWKPGQSVTVDGMDTAYTGAGNYNLTHKRIYRFNATEAGEDFRFLAEVELSDVSHVDDQGSLLAGGFIETESYFPPPDDMHSLLALPNGVLAGAAGNDVCFSEAGLFHAWPPQYRQSLDSPVVALAAAGTALFALTEGMPYAAVGVDPRGVSMERLEVPYGCVSARGVVDMGYSVIYPSADGLVVIRPGQLPQLLTEALLSPRQWRALAPETIHAYRWQDRYVAFYDGGGFIIDSRGREMSFTDLSADAGWSDPDNGELYLVVGDQVMRFDEGEALTFRWVSRDWYAPNPGGLAVARVEADDYPLQFRLWADGVQVVDHQVTGRRVFPLPPRAWGQRFRYELEGGSEVTQVELASTIEELRQS